MKNKIKQAIYNYCKKNPGMTYREIEDIFTANGYHWEGDGLSVSEEDGNVIFWEGWNKSAFDIISEMVRSGNLTRNPCSPLIYLIDGKMLTFPIVRKYPKGGYKNPHWLPCAFDAGENKL